MHRCNFTVASILVDLTVLGDRRRTKRCQSGRQCSSSSPCRARSPRKHLQHAAHPHPDPSPSPARPKRRQPLLRPQTRLPAASRAHARRLPSLWRRRLPASARKDRRDVAVPQTSIGNDAEDSVGRGDQTSISDRGSRACLEILPVWKNAISRRRLGHADIKRCCGPNRCGSSAVDHADVAAAPAGSGRAARAPRVDATSPMRTPVQLRGGRGRLRARPLGKDWVP